jgi:hypothetical protein
VSRRLAPMCILVSFWYVDVILAVTSAPGADLTNHIGGADLTKHFLIRQLASERVSSLINSGFPA